MKNDFEIFRCSAGFFGPLCQFEDSCYRNKSYCHHQAACQMVLVNIPDESTSYPPSLEVTGYTLAAYPECTCNDGTFGDHCESFNPCTESQKNQCNHVERCYQLSDGSPKCICFPGTIGKLCDKIVSVEDVCTKESCNNSGVCYEERGQAKCTCEDGFKGAKCEKKLDVCEQHFDICGGHGSCKSDSSDKTWRLVSILCIEIMSYDISML